MKIIKQEKDKIVRTLNFYTCKCSECGTIFEFNTEEFNTMVKSITLDKIGTVICPICKKENDVYKKDYFATVTIPKGWKAKMINKKENKEDE